MVFSSWKGFPHDNMLLMVCYLFHLFAIVPLLVFTHSSLIDYCKKHIPNLFFLSFGIESWSPRIQGLRVNFFLSNLCLSGSLCRRKSCCKEMVSTSRLEMRKFNGTKFMMWKLNMKDLLIDWDLSVAISSTKHNSMKYEEWLLWRERWEALSWFVWMIQYCWMFLKEKMQRIFGRR